MHTVTRSRRWRRPLIIALSAVLTAGLSAAALRQASAETVPSTRAADRSTNLEIVTPLLESFFGESLLTFKVTNRGPDAAPFSVVPWYYVEILFPITFQPQEGSCDAVGTEEQGSITWGVCTRYAGDGLDLPINRADEYAALFIGPNSVCDTFIVSVEPARDGIADPTPARATLSRGLSDQCG